ncbi:type II CRISPR-associated endonuclease Cas1 [Thermoflexibacter ruber]|uniref:CRISPR-associated endonuclease Cas1 n=1 Tax=Thermoflexibacter ruber TaxID=1003 RepID=A0A1I2F0T1_9BACT|nr:type II CRISPR-associated endonuclease Cas1 [Thermoflexibacter ruber]SFE98457.1 CRISP-associated protein Cas1 [Thermoflexibacter ruber]
MIKRTLYFGNPAYLSRKHEQLLIKIEGNAPLEPIPIEDIGIVIIDHQQVTVTQGLIQALLNNNVALITCDEKHLPTGLLLPLNVHSQQTLKFNRQISASEPTKKRLWQQTVKAKIRNQASLLQALGYEVRTLKDCIEEVQSGDSTNREAKAAAYYWGKIFSEFTDDFTRHPEGEPPNHLLNYGYAILRAIVARSLVGSGLLPTFGIHHHNQYNAYCLADDIMEPYRPYIDRLVHQILAEQNSLSFGDAVHTEGRGGAENRGRALTLTPSMKKIFLQIPVMDVSIDGDTRPLMVACQRTTASLSRCFEGEAKNILYPVL